MNPEKILFKEVTYHKNKGLRFIILFLGETVIILLVFIIMQLIKTNDLIHTPFLNYLIAAFLFIILFIAALLTWGGFLMQNDIIVTLTGVSKIFKMPPLVKRNSSFSKDKILSASWLSKDRIIYKNGKLINNYSKFTFPKNQFHQLIIEYEDKKELLIVTTKPDKLELAIGKMLKKNRS